MPKVGQQGRARPYWRTLGGGVEFYLGNVEAVLRGLPEKSVQMICTSPPYWGLRSYIGDEDPSKSHEIGLEATPALYVARMVNVFREVRRVLRDDGCVFLNLGDSYISSPRGNK